MAKPKYLVVVTAAAAAALLLTACGSSGSSGTTAASTTAPSPAASTAASPAVSAAAIPVPAVSYDATLHNELPASIKQSGTLSIDVFSNPPYIVVGQNNQVTGIGTQVFSALGTLLGLKIQYVPADGLAAAKLGVQSGRTDVAFGPFADNATIESDFNDIDWIGVGIALMYPKSAPVATNVLDLCGKRVASLTGSVPQVQQIALFDGLCAKAGRPDLKTSFYPQYSDMWLGVESGKADFGQTGSFQAVVFAEENSNLRVFNIPRTIIPTILCGNVVLKSDTALSQVYLAAMKQLWALGVPQALMTNGGINKLDIPEGVSYDQASTVGR